MLRMESSCRQLLLELVEFVLQRPHLLVPFHLQNVSAGVSDSVSATSIFNFHIHIFTPLSSKVTSIHDPLLRGHTFAKFQIV